MTTRQPIFRPADLRKAAHLARFDADMDAATADMLEQIGGANGKTD